MRQIQRPRSRTRKPIRTVEPGQPAVRPDVRRWLARLGPANAPDPRPHSAAQMQRGRR
jgi:hypothetical protein